MLSDDTERFRITTNTGRLANYNPEWLCWKTWQRCLLGDWHIILFASDRDRAMERFKNEYRDKQVKGESVDSLEQLK